MSSNLIHAPSDRPGPSCPSALLRNPGRSSAYPHVRPVRSCVFVPKLQAAISRWWREDCATRSASPLRPTEICSSPETGYDDRGTRPVWGASDVLWRIISGTWYGWPDYVAGEPITMSKFRSPGKPAPQWQVRPIRYYALRHAFPCTLRRTDLISPATPLAMRAKPSSWARVCGPPQDAGRRAAPNPLHPLSFSPTRSSDNDATCSTRTTILAILMEPRGSALQS